MTESGKKHVKACDVVRGESCSSKHESTSALASKTEKRIAPASGASCTDVVAVAKKTDASMGKVDKLVLAEPLKKVATAPVIVSGEGCDSKKGSLFAKWSDAP